MSYCYTYNSSSEGLQDIEQILVQLETSKMLHRLFLNGKNNLSQFIVNAFENKSKMMSAIGIFTL